MYIAGLVTAVPVDKMEAYRKWAETSAAFFREFGCLEIVESCKDNVPTDQLTDFRRAVVAKDDEKIVFSWQVWPSKAFLDAAEEKRRQDPRMGITGDIAFDAKPKLLGLWNTIDRLRADFDAGHQNNTQNTRKRG